MIYFVSEFSVVDIRLLPRDRRGEVIYPNIPKEKGIFALFMLFIIIFNFWNSFWRYFCDHVLSRPTLPDVPPGEAPGPATNLTLDQEAGGWVLRWIGPKVSCPTKNSLSDKSIMSILIYSLQKEGKEDPNLRYYTVQIKKDKDDEEWQPLSDQKIDVDEASYLSEFC